MKLHSEFMCGNISRPFTPRYFTLSNEGYWPHMSALLFFFVAHTWFYESCVNLLIFQTEIPYPDQVHPWRVLKKYVKELG